jgi:hypothetical protein
VQAKLLPYFDYVGTAKVKCKSCGAELDTRGGRAITHLKSHGIVMMGAEETKEVEELVEESVPAPPEERPGLARGSREWAVEMVLEVASSKQSTSEQKLKALDLLKEYQDFGTKRLDDEKEAEASRLQWERVFAKVGDLRKQEETLLKDPAVRVRLKAALEAVK